MVFQVIKVRRGNPYLYEVTAYRDKNGKPKQHWKYIGPATAEGRQELSEEAMHDLSDVLLRHGLSAEAIRSVAKKHGLRLPRRDPKVINLENDRRRRKLSARFK